VHKVIAREHEHVDIQAAGVTRKLLARLDSEANVLAISDMAGAARNAGTIGGIAADIVIMARERPAPAR
jgi:hypothetical protein